MALLVDNTETKMPASTRSGVANSHWPVGAPKESYVRELLGTLAGRLEAQLATEDDDVAVETRAIREDARYRLNQVNEAMRRIEDGKYGLCVDCVTPINADRLVIQPFATRCTSCQERHERQYRRPTTQN